MTQKIINIGLVFFALVLLLTLVTTTPDRIGGGGIILWFLFLAIFLLMALYSVVAKFSISSKPFLTSLVGSMTVVLILALSSLGQLSIGDLLLVVVIDALIYFLAAAKGRS